MVESEKKIGWLKILNRIVFQTDLKMEIGDYQDFLQRRRELMAEKIHQYYAIPSDFKGET